MSPGCPGHRRACPACGREAVAEAVAVVGAALGHQGRLLLVGEAVVEGVELGQEALHQLEPDGVVADLGGQALDRVRADGLGVGGSGIGSAGLAALVGVLGLRGEGRRS